jgi:uncharacterized protein YegP (UPF0339 family)
MSAFPKFQVYKSLIKDEYFYQLKSDNYEIILCGTGYASKLACFKDIELVKFNSQMDLRYQKSNRLNFFTFTLEASDGKIIGQGESYNSTYARDNAIDMVKSDAFIASVEDLTEYTDTTSTSADISIDYPTDATSDTSFQGSINAAPDAGLAGDTVTGLCQPDQGPAPSNS